MDNKRHPKKEMEKSVEYIVICNKIVEAHRHRCYCECKDVVMNLMGGRRIWTRIEFECGERVKVNCHCLEKLV